MIRYESIKSKCLQLCVSQLWALNFVGKVVSYIFKNITNCVYIGLRQVLAQDMEF